MAGRGGIISSGSRWCWTGGKGGGGAVAVRWACSCARALKIAVGMVGAGSGMVIGASITSSALCGSVLFTGCSRLMLLTTFRPDKVAAAVSGLFGCEEASALTVDGAFVLGEQVSHEEVFGAELALEPLAGVAADVGLQVVALGEGGVAVGALVGLLARVGPHVDRQVVSPANPNYQKICIKGTGEINA